LILVGLTMRPIGQAFLYYDVYEVSIGKAPGVNLRLGLELQSIQVPMELRQWSSNSKMLRVGKVASNGIIEQLGVRKDDLIVGEARRFGRTLDTRTTFAATAPWTFLSIDQIVAKIARSLSKTSFTFFVARKKDSLILAEHSFQDATVATVGHIGANAGARSIAGALEAVGVDETRAEATGAARESGETATDGALEPTRLETVSPPTVVAVGEVGVDKTLGADNKGAEAHGESKSFGTWGSREAEKGATLTSRAAGIGNSGVEIKGSAGVAVAVKAFGSIGAEPEAPPPVGAVDVDWTAAETTAAGGVGGETVANTAPMVHVVEDNTWPLMTGALTKIAKLNGGTYDVMSVILFKVPCAYFALGLAVSFPTALEQKELSTFPECATITRVMKVHGTILQRIGVRPGDILVQFNEGTSQLATQNEACWTLMNRTGLQEMIDRSINESLFVFYIARETTRTESCPTLVEHHPESGVVVFDHTDNVGSYSPRGSELASPYVDGAPPPTKVQSCERPVPPAQMPHHAEESRAAKIRG
jgi:hypothetical protein